MRESELILLSMCSIVGLFLVVIPLLKPGAVDKHASNLHKPNPDDWKGQGMVEYALVLTLVLTVVIVVLSIISGSTKNNIPENVEHSTIAVQKVETCVRANSGATEYGLTLYPNALIECLYMSGIELRYNGEPVRRVTE